MLQVVRDPAGPSRYRIKQKELDLLIGPPIDDFDLADDIRRWLESTMELDMALFVNPEGPQLMAIADCTECHRITCACCPSGKAVHDA